MQITILINFILEYPIMSYLSVFLAILHIPPVTLGKIRQNKSYYNVEDINQQTSK